MEMQDSEFETFLVPITPGLAVEQPDFAVGNPNHLPAMTGCLCPFRAYYAVINEPDNSVWRWSMVPTLFCMFHILKWLPAFRGWLMAIRSLEDRSRSHY